MDHMTESPDHLHGEQVPQNTSFGHGQAFFYWSVTQQMLFEWWITRNNRDLALACLYVVLVSLVNEGLKIVRGFITKTQKKNCSESSSAKYSVSKSYHTKSTRKSHRQNALFLCLHFTQTILYMVQVFVSMMLMLVFMTFNLYLCLAVIVGAGVGHLLCDWRTVGTGSGVGQNRCV